MTIINTSRNKCWQGYGERGTILHCWWEKGFHSDWCSHCGKQYVDTFFFFQEEQKFIYSGRVSTAIFVFPPSHNPVPWSHPASFAVVVGCVGTVFPADVLSLCSAKHTSYNACQSLKVIDSFLLSSANWLYVHMLFFGSAPDLSLFF